ncbi:MAG: GNAT family N-acetyltransferase [Bryobacterales bacterium]|nr:GNAT family N-acetyltransferase [Bryobacteraceae bacterium]MDW8354964.1 GNAT family N-acetyltransferase [Bryobacterales bacterium]
MAAAPNVSAWEVVELRSVAAAELAPVLEQEVAEWRESLNWDFRPSADLVLRFVASQALAGYALRLAGAVSGYTYVVSEARKAVIGDLYLLRERRSVDNENLLLTAAVESLFANPCVRRIESQLLLLSRPLDRPLPLPYWVTRYPRRFLALDALCAVRLPPAILRGFDLLPWDEQYTEAAARLITAAYQGHIDSRVNDQYRSLAGARRFLFNVVQYPGCGVFLPGASFVAVASNGQLAGLCLASRLSAEAGHITQICVDPRFQGLGVGYELLRRSLRALAARGCQRITLSVTTANRAAVALYERVGFETVREFAACVWERPHQEDILKL